MMGRIKCVVYTEKFVRICPGRRLPALSFIEGEEIRTEFRNSAVVLLKLMKLPHRKNAYIPAEKLTEYLLSETHTVGRLKAKFFESIGYDQTNQTQLEQEFYKIGHNEEVREVASSPYGKKYIIDGIIKTPTGRNVKLRTVWIIESDTDQPRFITAYPV